MVSKRSSPRNIPDNSGTWAFEGNFLLRILEESINEIYVFDAVTWRFLYVNPSAINNLGYSNNELARMTPLDIKPKLTRMEFESLLSPLLSGEKKKVFFETFHQRKDKSLYPVEVQLQHIKSVEHSIFVAVILDLSEKELALEAVRGSEQRFRATLYSIGDAVIATDKNGLVMCMNPIAENLTGYSEKEATGRSLNEIFRIVNEFTGQEAESPVERVLQEGKIVGLANHTMLIHRDGRQIPITDSGAPIWGDDGKLQGVVLVFRDQTQERKWQHEIAASEARYRSLFESAAVGIALHEIVTDENGKPVDYIILDVNRRFEEITGIPKEIAIGQKASLLFGTGSPPYFDYYLPVAQNGHMVSFETYFEPMRKHFYISVYSPERGKFATTFIDITPLKNAIQEIEKKSLQFSKMFYEHSAVKLILDPKTGQIVDANHAAEKFYGWTKEKLCTMKISDINTLPTEKVREEMEKVISGKQNYFEFSHRLADGSERNVEVFSTSIEMDGREVLYSIIHDVTEKQKAKEAVLFEQYLMNSLMDTTPDLIYFKDIDSRLIRVNKAVLNCFGFQYEDEIIGKTDFDLFSQEYALQTFNDEQQIIRKVVHLSGSRKR